MKVYLAEYYHRYVRCGHILYKVLVVAENKEDALESLLAQYEYENEDEWKISEIDTNVKQTLTMKIESA